MSKLECYTAGPWYAGKLIEDHRGCEFISIGDCDEEEHYEDTICQVFHGNHDGEENAKLIAASPQLYEALLEAKEALDSLGLNLVNVDKAIEKVEK